MKILKHEPKSDKTLTGKVADGYFNGGEHLFVSIEPEAYQTISCRLPNGRYVTFAFVPGKRGTDEIGCVDIHTTVGKPFLRERPADDYDVAYPQQLVGFRRGPDTFDTRELPHVTTLTTLLLGDQHYTK